MTKINLLPWRERLREERKRSFLMSLAATAGAAIVFMALVHLVIANQMSRQSVRNDFLRNEIVVLNQQINEIKDLQKQKEALIARMGIIQELQANRPQIVHLFDELIKILPKGVHLSNVVRRGDQVQLIGIAESNTNVSDLMRNINKSHWLAKPQLSEIKTETIKGKAMSEFKLGLALIHPDMTTDRGTESGDQS